MLRLAGGWRANTGAGAMPPKLLPPSLDFGFGELGLAEIVSFTSTVNHRSRRVMERIGMTRVPEDDFDHPYLGEGHLLRRHVLYRISRSQRLAIQG